MFTRVALVATLLVAAGCSPDAGRQAAAAVDAANAQNPAPTAPMDPVARPGTATGFATLPDRGELLAYPGRVVRREGAYTWHLADLSEEHALRALAGARLRVTTPDGEILDFAYDRHVEHASGDWTWIGHRPGHEGEQTILTFGAQAAFGSISQPGKPPLRLAVRDGRSWLVETDPAKVAGIVNAATRPQRPDYHIVPESELPRSRASGVVAAADGATTSPGAPATSSASATATATSVDLIIGYTSGFATAQGGTSAAMTRLNYLVDVANAAYGNSNVSAKVRLVKAIQVDYPDTTSNDIALEKMSGYKSGSGPVTPDAAFDGLRAAREQYGADLVSLVRDFRDPEQEGCGLAWLLGGGLQGIGPNEGWDELGYSVVGDGSDVGSDGKSYYCQDETLAHELGHNMGAAHDQETAQGDDGVLNNPDDYGAYTYSFGYKVGATAGNFYTIMAYGDTGQKIYRIFSNPSSTFCGGRACGVSNESDNARTLRQTIPTIGGFRIAPASSARRDFNGDGMSDILWRHGATGADTIWLSGDSARRQLVATVSDLNWQVVGTGDFDGDGISDVLWRNGKTGANTIWKAANSAQQLAVTTASDLRWQVAGIGDFDGDGISDVLWRHGGTGANTIWLSADSARRQVVATVSDLGWQVSGIGDFDGDRRSDILWRHGSTGANTIWLSGDSARRQVVATVSDLRWKVAGIGDFDGDAISDLLWRHAGTGANTVWLSGDSGRRLMVATVGDLRWQVAGTGDFNGDGGTDILWRHGATGANTIWLSSDSTHRQVVATISDMRWLVVGLLP